VFVHTKRIAGEEPTTEEEAVAKPLKGTTPSASSRECDNALHPCRAACDRGHRRFVSVFAAHSLPPVMRWRMSCEAGSNAMPRSFVQVRWAAAGKA